MVLHHGNPALHPRGFRRCQPLPHIGPRRRREKSRVFTPAPPLLARVRVQPVVEKGIKLHLVPRQLPLRGQRMQRGRLIVGVGKSLLHEHKFALAPALRKREESRQKKQDERKTILHDFYSLRNSAPGCVPRQGSSGKANLFSRKVPPLCGKSAAYFLEKPRRFPRKAPHLFSGKPPRPPSGLHFYPK